MQPGLVSPVFVGRGTELAALVAALESAVAGAPAVVLVGGEAGVGKTRLVEEAAERARSDGARVLTGSCIELGGEGVPLSPLVDALRTLMRVMDRDVLEGFLGPARPDLARLLPELDPQAANAPAPGGESSSGRLLELVFGVVQRLAADRPLMFVIEASSGRTARRLTSSRSWCGRCAASGCCSCSPSARTRSTDRMRCGP
jgi:hypothetical protein